MEKLGLTTVELAFSQASLDESKATLTQTSASTTFSLLAAVATRAKVEIKDRDDTIREQADTIMELLELKNSSEIKTKYVPPPLDEKRVYLGKESPSTIFKTNHYRLHYLNIIPLHCRSKIEEDEISELMKFFKDEKVAGNVEGEPCGLGKMWMLPNTINSTFIHYIKGEKDNFAEYVDIKCKGECPSLEEGRRALLRGRRQKATGGKRVNRTCFDVDEYLINVSKDVFEHCFGVPLKSNAAMWITSRSGIIIYAFKNERDSLMLLTKGTANIKTARYAGCRASIQIVQGDVGELKSNLIHRVMMMANSPIFDPQQWILWEVDHIRSEGKRNDVLNLRWVLPFTNKENFFGRKSDEQKEEE